MIAAGGVLILYVLLSYVVNWHFVAQQQANYLQWGKPVKLTVVGRPAFHFAFPLRITFDRMDITPVPSDNPALPHIALHNVSASLSFGGILRGKFYADRVRADKVVVSVAGTTVELHKVETILDKVTRYAVLMHGQYRWDGQEYDYTVDLSFREDYPAMNFKTTLQERDGRKLAINFSGVGSRFDRKVVLEFDNIVVGQAVGTGWITLKPGSTMESFISTNGRFNMNRFTDRRSFFSDQDFALMVAFANRSTMNGGLSLRIKELNLQGLAIQNAMLAGKLQPRQPVALRAEAVLPSKSRLKGSASLVVMENDYWHIRDIRLSTGETDIQGDVAFRYGEDPLYKIDIRGRKLVLDDLKTLETEPWINEARMLKQPLKVSVNVDEMITPGGRYPQLLTSAMLTSKAVNIQKMRFSTHGGGLFQLRGVLGIDSFIPQLDMELLTAGTALSDLAPSRSLAEFWLRRLDGKAQFTLKGGVNNTRLVATHRTPNSSLSAEGTLKILASPVLFEGSGRFLYSQDTPQGAVYMDASAKLKKDASGGRLSEVTGRVGDGTFSGEAILKKLPDRKPLLTGSFAMDQLNLATAMRLIRFLPAPVDVAAALGSEDISASATTPEDALESALTSDGGGCGAVWNIPFSGQPLGLRRLGYYDVDVQASIGRIVRRASSFNNNRLAVRVQDGQLSSRFEADFSRGGHLNAAIQAGESSGGEPTIRTRLQLQDYAVVSANDNMRASLGLNWDSDSYGDCLTGHLGTLKGQAVADVQGLTVPGVNLAEVNQALRDFRGIGQADNLLAVIKRQGQMRIERLGARMSIEQGNITVRNANAFFNGGSAQLQGSLNAFERQVNARAQVSFEAVPGAPPLLVDTTGDIFQPVITIRNRAQLARYLIGNAASPLGQ